MLVLGHSVPYGGVEDVIKSEDYNLDRSTVHHTSIHCKWTRVNPLLLVYSVGLHFELARIRPNACSAVCPTSR